ncbi:MAG: glycosyltransferase family 2 protein [Clostridia bacterium]|nr:glycosyltransferase family 2 protein [Clostridia bacterium]
MPVYMVEGYVGRAIESIQSQTFSDWELFAVDDGSPDQSGAICDKYAEADPRITVIHKENGGAPSARNTAIAHTSGKYLDFLDSDDWAEPQMLENMVELAEKNNSQLVISGYYIDTYYSDTEKFTQIQSAPGAVYKNAADFRNDAYLLFDRNLLYTPWNKLYNAEYIKTNNIFFPQTFWDDFPFNIEVIRDIERVCVTADPFYHFIRKRQESETAKYRPDMYEKREEENGWLIDLFKYWGVSSPESDEFIARRYIERLIGCIENVTNKSCTLKTREKRVEVKRMISSDRARTALKLTKPRSGYMKLMLIPLKLGNVTLTLLQSGVISFIKRRSTRLFAKLKAGR